MRNMVLAGLCAVAILSTTNHAHALLLPSKDDVISTIKGALRGLKGGCDKVVDALGGRDPGHYFLDKVDPALGKCHSAFSKGLVCGIPNALVGLGEAALNVAGEVWHHKYTCLLAGGLNPAGITMCGTYYLAKKGIKKAAKCFKALQHSHAKKVLKALWGAIADFACTKAGEATADILLAAATEGASAPGAVLSWLKRISAALSHLSPSTVLKIQNALGGASVDHTVGMLKAAVKSACQ